MTSKRWCVSSPCCRISFPFWPIVRRLFISWESRQFDSEGDYLTEHWAPLTAEYEAWKAVNYPNKRILQRTGALRRAATTPRQVATPLSLTLFIDEYTVEGRQADPDWFDSGTDRMPARPLLFDDLPPAEPMAELQAAAEAYAHRIAVSSGLLKV